MKAWEQRWTRHSRAGLSCGRFTAQFASGKGTLSKLGNLAKSFQRIVFGIMNFEDGEQLGDLHEVVDALGKVS